MYSYGNTNDPYLWLFLGFVCMSIGFYRLIKGPPKDEEDEDA